MPWFQYKMECDAQLVSWFSIRPSGVRDIPSRSCDNDSDF